MQPGNNILYVPNRVNIIKIDDTYVVYDPITSIILSHSIFENMAENWALGFLDCMQGFACNNQPSGLFNHPENPESDEYKTYMVGAKFAAEICELHMRNGGSFALKDDHSFLEKFKSDD